MFQRFKRKMSLRKIDKLATDALAEAARAFDSGEFSWTRGSLLVDAGGLDKSYEDDMSKVTGGCLLGGITKAAWIVAGRPEHGSPGWRLKEAIETRAYQRAFVTSIEGVESALVGDGSPQTLHVSPYRYNDSYANGPSDIVEHVLTPALTADAERLPDVSAAKLGNRIENADNNPYTGNKSELLQELYEQS